jgi:lactoylglutathione lyase
MKMQFITVQTKNIAVSIDFWERVLGYRVSRRFSPRPGMEIVFMGDAGGCEIEFIAGGDGDTFSGKGISLGFHVDDMEKTQAMLLAQSVEIVSGPLTLPNGSRMLRARDPNGLELSFLQEGKHS